MKFNVGFRTPMKILKKKFAKQLEVQANSLRFLFEGKRINDENTAEDFDMKDGDEIEVFAEQGGRQDVDVVDKIPKYVEEMVVEAHHSKSYEKYEEATDEWEIKSKDMVNDTPTGSKRGREDVSDLYLKLKRKKDKKADKADIEYVGQIAKNAVLDQVEVILAKVDQVKELSEELLIEKKLELIKFINSAEKESNYNKKIMIGCDEELGELEMEMTSNDKKMEKLIRDQDQIVRKILTISQNSEDIKKAMATIEHRKQDLNAENIFNQSEMKRFKRMQEKLDNTIEMKKAGKLQQSLDQAQTSNVMMVKFLQDSIKEKEKFLECPVCFEITSPPINCCQEQHLICCKCRKGVKECPVCRRVYDKEIRRYKDAEQVVEEVRGLEEQLERLNNQQV